MCQRAGGARAAAHNAVRAPPARQATRWATPTSIRFGQLISIVRKRLALYTTALGWFVGVYVLWLGPPFLAHSAIVLHGLFGPTSSSNFGALWWLDYWQDAPVNLRFHTVGVAFTLALTIALTWFCISLYRSWSTATPIRIRFWPSLRERRLRRGECPRCGYQLADRAALGCSECGWHPLGRPPALVIKDGRIASHLRCIKCKYVLKGMAEDAACPECGRAVSDSVEAVTAAFPWTWFQRGVSGAAILVGVVLPIFNVIMYQSSLPPADHVYAAVTDHSRPLSAPASAPLKVGRNVAAVR